MPPGIERGQGGERLGQAGRHRLALELPHGIQVGAPAQRQAEQGAASPALLDRLPALQAHSVAAAPV